MNKQFLGAIYLVAAAASAAWSQNVPAPRIYGTSLGSATPAVYVGQPEAYTPTQIEQAYGLGTLMGGLGSGAIQDDGAGQTIAIIDAYHYDNALSAINTFSAGNIFGFGAYWTLPQMSASGPGPTFTQVNLSGNTANTNSDWNSEEALDMDYAHTMAPYANIVLYEANSNSDADLYAAIDAARNNPKVSVISMSWSSPEFPGETTLDSAYFTTPGTKAAVGKNVTFCAAIGDYGDLNESPGNGVSGYPAGSPNVVGLGGTSLNLNPDNSYNSESAWSWAGSPYFWGGSGGTCTQETQPSWQTSYGTAHPGNVLNTTTGSRATPDVSMVSDPFTGVIVYDPANGGWWAGNGGTSLACPCFAGLVADADEIRQSLNGTWLDGPSQTLPALYANSGDFHSITSGNISPTGNPNYSATAGYNLATGLGSPIANELVPDLANYGVTQAPEPSTLALLGAGAVALLATRWRRRSSTRLT